jgi:hypothetical protein
MNKKQKSLNNKKITIEYILQTLKDNGYMIEEMERELYTFYAIKGNCITGGFCTKHDSEDLLKASNEWINGNVAIEHKHLFDKWRKCPLIVPIPETQKDLDKLIDRMKFWGSEDGYKKSSEFEYDEWTLEHLPFLK